MSNIIISIPENFAVKEADEIRQESEKLFKEGNRNFIFDFNNCKFIDSTGLGVLVSISKKCNEIGGHMEVQSVNNPDVLRIFKLTRLNEVFGI